MIFFTTKTHEQRVLDHLKKVGRRGAFGHDLAKPGIGGWRFGEYVRALRSKGHVIETVRISGSNKTKYYLRPELLKEAE